MDAQSAFLSDKLFQAEADRCESCVEKPCLRACPVGCCPGEFIHAARGLSPSDFQRAAAMILKQNPLGGICGHICGEKHCMSACSRGKTGLPVNIPALQSYIIEKANAAEVADCFAPVVQKGRPVAVLGGGPSGLAAAAVLAQAGKAVTVFETADEAGGMCRLIPELRLPQAAVRKDISFIKNLGITLKTAQPAQNPAALLSTYDFVINATGRWQKSPFRPEGGELAQDALDYLQAPSVARHPAIIGCGGIAVDCALRALENGAAQVDIFALETLCELPLNEKERKFLFTAGIQLHLRTGIRRIAAQGAQALSLQVQEMRLQDGQRFHPAAMLACEESIRELGPFDLVILAIGSTAAAVVDNPRIFSCGENADGAATVVEAVASGKLAAQRALERAQPSAQSPLGGYRALPVSLETELFGRRVRSPFFVSASPPSDGYAQMKAAYDAGWAGGILKTAFDGVPIHTPGEYMQGQDRFSFANCDGVSARALDEICHDVERLCREYPDRMTMASTGGEITGNDSADRDSWLRCTHKLENAGAMGIEYSLSCPGADGAEELAVNQSGEKTAQIVRWILQGANAQVPKLFKLTASVADIGRIVDRVVGVAKEFPHCQVGITIGDTLPILVFQNRGGKHWENGVAMGMGGKGIAPINAFAIAKSIHRGVPICASGGVMSYRDAANYLAMGVDFVQVCSMIMRYGYGVIEELESGLSHLMHSRALAGISALRCATGGEIILPYEKITAVKKIPTVDTARCSSCGNCSRCPAQAVRLNASGFPEFDPKKCIGCSFCNHLCFTGALQMRPRNSDEI